MGKIPTYRRFDGKRYGIFSQVYTKDQVERYKKVAQSEGYYVRVAKYKNVPGPGRYIHPTAWGIFVRSKGW